MKRVPAEPDRNTVFTRILDEGISAMRQSNDSINSSTSSARRSISSSVRKRELRQVLDELKGSHSSQKLFENPLRSSQNS